ncbi:MAG TPA: hypothetical protein VJB87_05590 [Candidatus Nanoarchaeia archaeon]|nr:hypothetical protein [Candidatus Nanoarchaeia archaeon]
MKLTLSQKNILDQILVAKTRKLPVDGIIGEFNCLYSPIRSQLGPFQEWFGVDTDKDGLKKIKAEVKSDKVHVRYGIVSEHVDIPDNACDILLCPLQLHEQVDLAAALVVLQAKVAFGGKVIIIDVNNSEKTRRSAEEDRVYYHKEKDIEMLVGKLRGFSKSSQDIFVVYEWLKV